MFLTFTEYSIGKLFHTSSDINIFLNIMSLLCFYNSMRKIINKNKRLKYERVLSTSALYLFVSLILKI